jgi:hypothetical protein
LHRDHDHITEAGVAAARATEDLDALDAASAAVVRNIEN